MSFFEDLCAVMMIATFLLRRVCTSPLSQFTNTHSHLLGLFYYAWQHLIRAHNFTHFVKNTHAGRFVMLLGFLDDDETKRNNYD